jgi:hypothetical protein
VGSRYHLAVAGRVPTGVVDLIRARFGDVAIRAGPDRTVLDGAIADQAAVRALVTLLWDTGSEIRLLRVTGEEDLLG